MIRNSFFHSPLHRTRKPLPVRMPAYPIDEKAAFVEHVCGVLVESRYGPGAAADPFLYFDSFGDELPKVCFDLMPASVVPEQLVERYEREETRTRDREHSLKEASGSSSCAGAFALSSPSTLGRGSPVSFGTHVAEARTE